MYCDYFSLSEPPFSIVPDPRFLFMSERHQEALAHLLYGVQGQGGFILVTGEVGTGKTTVCKGFLNQIPENTDVAYIINPRLSVLELLETLCDELGISTNQLETTKHYVDVISQYLLDAHAKNRHTVLMIDEAQNLSESVLEQIRLLTNLETHEKKLLQIILIGQPELNELLQKRSLRQLSQRITARYHLEGLNQQETESYIYFRLSVAGCKKPLFDRSAVRAIYKSTNGIPRLINLVCDRCLLAAYGKDASSITRGLVYKSAKEALFPVASEVPSTRAVNTRYTLVGLLGAASLLFVFYYSGGSVWRTSNPQADEPPPAQLQAKSKSMPDVQQEDSSRPRFSWSQMVHDESSAYPILSSIWGSQSADQEGKKNVCSQVELVGLKCLFKRGSWRAFVDFNRPGLLKVFNRDLQKFAYVLVKKVKGHHVLIVTTNGSESWIETSELQKWWLGEFALIWKLPPYRSPLVKPGQPKKKSEWLSVSLPGIKHRWNVGLDLQNVNVTEQQYAEILRFTQSSNDLALAEQVKLFQLAVGLVGDGIAGEKTQIRLNTELDDSIPLLYPSIGQTIALLENK